MIVFDMFFTVLFLVLIWFIFCLFKVDNASKNREKIIDAIDVYAVITGDCVTALCALKAMEDFDSTIYRLWDWGYKNILPNEYFELIESYIQ